MSSLLRSCGRSHRLRRLASLPLELFVRLRRIASKNAPQFLELIFQSLYIFQVFPRRTFPVLNQESTYAPLVFTCVTDGNAGAPHLDHEISQDSSEITSHTFFLRHKSQALPGRDNLDSSGLLCPPSSAGDVSCCSPRNHPLVAAPGVRVPEVPGEIDSSSSSSCSMRKKKDGIVWDFRDV